MVGFVEGRGNGGKPTDELEAEVDGIGLYC